MEKRDNAQLDLFSPDSLGRQDVGKPENLFFAYMRAYEKAVLVIIGLVITGLVCFMLGMERGRRVITAQYNARLIELARQQRSPVKQLPQRAAAGVLPFQREQSPPAVSVPSAVPLSPVKQLPATQPATREQPGTREKCTIQLASFKSRAYAEKEADYLKRKGFSPALVKDGAYIVLCVGMFQDEEKAQPLLVEFRKRYSGCHIRRL